MPSQWFAVVLVGALALAALSAGVFASARPDRLSALRGGVPGLAPGLVLLGIGGALFTIEVVYQVASDATAWSPLSRWWFMGPRVPGDALDAMLGSPTFAFIAIGAAVLRWGAPSPTEVALVLRQLGEPEHRSHAIRVLLDIPLLLIGAVAGGLAAGLLLAPGFAVAGAIAGGLLLWRVFGYDEKKERRVRNG